MHLAVFCGDDDVRHRLLHDIFAAAMELGGAISGEHGLGRIKMRHFLELEDPVKIALMRRIKVHSTPPASSTPARCSTERQSNEQRRAGASRLVDRDGRDV
jgi:glycolate dehydrogenase FAD-linked subunit